VQAADVPYVPTPWNVVDAMLKLAAVGPDDYLIDLGSGDGRIVITAAKKIGTRGFGVDLDDNLVRTANREAERQGVKDRAAFYTRNLFDTDMAKASVISMYLLHSVNLRLRPLLFKLKPGTRIVSHDFDMAAWTPDEKMSIAVPNKSYGPPSSEIFLWIMPADVSGRWRWQMGDASKAEAEVTLEQTFQMLAGNGQVAGARALVRDARVRGEHVTFTLMIERDGRVQHQQFSGRISGESIEGRTTADGVQTPWRAARIGGRGRMIIDVRREPNPDVVAGQFLIKEQQ
jgi:SAM-dependent methyltransferase